MAVKLLIVLFARQNDFVGIDHNHVIAGIEERGPGRFVFAHQDPGRIASELAEHDAIRV